MVGLFLLTISHSFVPGLVSRAWKIEKILHYLQTGYGKNPCKGFGGKKRIDKRILVCYKHIILIGFTSEAIMRRASFNCMMCCDMRCEMRVCFALPI